MKSAFVIGVASAVAVVLSASAGNYYWTGASDNKWVNPANWAVDGANGRETATIAPGVITNGAGSVVSSDIDATAVFGPVAQGAPTVIDVVGVQEIKSFRFTGANAPSYKLGAEGVQRFCLSAWSYVTVDADVTADQSFNGTLLFANVANRGMYVTNNSEQATLVINKIDLNSNPGDPVFKIYGPGTVRYAAATVGNWGPAFDFYQTGVFECTTEVLTKYWRTYPVTGHPGVRRMRCAGTGNCFGGKNGGTWVNSWWIRENTVIEGPGYWYLDANSTYAGFPYARSVQVAAGKKLTVEAIVRTMNANAFRLMAIDAATTGGGTMELLNTNMISGALFIGGGATIRAAKFGPKFTGNTWEQSNLGRHQDILVGMGNGSNGGDGTLEYSGAGETGFDSTFGLVVPSVGTLRNDGTGSLEFAGVVTAAVAGASFRFDAARAPIDFTGGFAGENAIAMRVAGESRTVVHGRPAASGVGLENGTLSFAADATAYDLPSVSVVSGTGVIEIPENAALAVDSVSVTGGELRFAAADGATVTVRSHEGDCPARVFLNGRAARWDENGVLRQNVTAWKTATSGDWSGADNWTAGVPGAGQTAEIQASGASYVVSRGAATELADHILVGNETEGETATLAIAGGYAFENASVELGKGGVMSVAGGLTIANTAAGGGRFTVGDDARLLLADGELTLSAAADDFEVGNDGRVEFSDGARFNMPPGFKVDSGTFLFGGSSTFTNATGGPLVIGAKRPNETATLDLALDGAATKVAVNKESICIGSEASGGRGVLMIRPSNKTQWDSVFADSANAIAVGYRSGHGELVVSNGNVGCGNYGITIGTWRTGDGNGYFDSYAGPYCVTGVVTVAGGRLSGSGWGSYYNGAPFCGIQVGDGGQINRNYFEDGSLYYGRLNVKGGTVVANGTLGVGIGQGHGEVFVTGGTLEIGYADMSYGGGTYSLGGVLGVFGGRGYMSLSNGTVTAKYDFYVGGQPADTVERPEAVRMSEAKGYPVNNHDARGWLRVNGGSFTCASYDVIVGADGSGVIEFGDAWRDGSGAVVKGSLTTKNLVLSDGGEASLLFTLGDDGVASLDVTGTMTVAPGAKLVVDARGITGRFPPWTKLASVAAFDGAFAADDITVLAPADNPQFPAVGSQVVFERDGETGIWLRRAPIGTLLLVR